MGDRWDMVDPPPEAYSRVTNPERFRPLHGFAEQLLDRLEAEFEVTREEGHGLDTELERGDMARPTVRLMPRVPDGGTLTIAFSSFPGLGARLGHWFVELIPHCGCDACDETAEEGQGELESLTTALTSGELSESIKLPLLGDGWLAYKVSGYGEGRSRISRAQARASINQAGGRSRFDYRPWPRRGGASPNRDE